MTSADHRQQRHTGDKTPWATSTHLPFALNNANSCANPQLWFVDSSTRMLRAKIKTVNAPFLCGMQVTVLYCHVNVVAYATLPVDYNAAQFFFFINYIFESIISSAMRICMCGSVVESDPAAKPHFSHIFIHSSATCQHAFAT